jgi:hypothetical protein
MALDGPVPKQLAIDNVVDKPGVNVPDVMTELLQEMA